MARASFSYTHGDTGSKPSGSLDFRSNQRPDAQNFDWYWYNVIEAIKDHAEEFDRLDSDDDGVVDEANYAANAGKVGGLEPSQLVKTSEPSSVDVRDDPPDNPEDGQTWILR